MPEVGDHVYRLTRPLARLWSRAAVRITPALPEVLVACVVVMLIAALAVPWAVLFEARPAEAGAVNAFVEACQRGARRGPLGLAGYAAGALVFAWAAMSTLRLAWRLCREGWALRRASGALRDVSEDIEVFVGGRVLSVRVLDAPGRVAFASGLLRPRIYVGRSVLTDLDPDELAAVLEHEAEHVRRRHPLKCWLVDLLCAATWWPGLRAVKTQYRAQREAAADAVAVARVGDATPLLRAIQLTDPVPAGLASCGIATRTDAALQRIRLEGKSLSGRQVARFAGGLTLVVALLLFAVVGLADWQLYWFCPDGARTVA